MKNTPEDFVRLPLFGDEAAPAYMNVLRESICAYSLTTSTRTATPFMLVYLGGGRPPFPIECASEAEFEIAVFGRVRAS